MTAKNSVGEVQTDEVSYVLAAVPDQPTEVPKLNLLFTRNSTLHVDYAAIPTTKNGGSPILSYELSIYNQTQQIWTSIAGGKN